MTVSDHKLSRLTMVRQTCPMEELFVEKPFAEELLSDSSLSSGLTDNLKPEDGSILGKLMYRAYKGTVDDEGQSLEESIVEAEETLSGKYGNIIWQASFVSKINTTLTSTTVLTDYSKTGPLLAYILTDPDYQKRGLAAKLIKQSICSLHLLKIKEVRLVVTEQNIPAVNLYKKLGFEIESIRK